MKMMNKMKHGRSRATRGVPVMRRRARGATLAAVVLAAFAFSLPALARPDRGHHRWGGPSGWVERHAERLGIDEATLAEIETIVEASRAEGEAIYAEHRAARDTMRALIEADEPDVDAVMLQAEVIGEIDVRKHKHRLATMLEIRAKLTPEQRAELRVLKDERHARRGEHRKGGKHHRHGRGDCGKDDPAAEGPL